MDLSLSGLSSGFDWKTLVGQLVDVERAPQKRLQTEQNTIQQRNLAFGSIKTQLLTFSNKVDALKSSDIFSNRAGSVGDAAVASVSTSNGAALGSYAFNITRMASAARWDGAPGAGKAIAPTDEVSGVVLADAGFSTAITAGSFTVNGKSVAIETTDTLQGVFDKISTATGGAVSGRYDSASDKIQLTSAGTIVLGSATDTGNFLSAARLYNSGSGTVTSGTSLGGVQMSRTLEQANLGTDISDNGSGEFKVNGVSIAYSSSSDTVQSVLDRINASQAGVIASFDSINNRFQLTNKSTGDVGVNIEDVAGKGNFVSATGLGSGSLHRGGNLAYTINGGGELTSSSNTISEASSGLAGLSVTVIKTGSTSVTVGTDTSKAKQAIKDFVSEYNRVQSLIETETASSTDAQGKVTAALLATDPDAFSIASSFRALAFSADSSGSSVFQRLADLGIKSNGTDNTLTLDSDTKLDDALANHLTELADLFTNTTSGLATRFSSYLETTTGDDGSLTAKQALLTKQVGGIDAQIADMERLVQDRKQRLTDSFIAMETASAQSNEQLKYLQKTFP